MFSFNHIHNLDLRLLKVLSIFLLKVEKNGFVEVWGDREFDSWNELKI